MVMVNESARSRKRLSKGVAVLLFLVFAIVAVVYSESLKERAVVGRPAPEFTLADLNGRSVSLSDFRGRIVLINFWNEWCDPCREEAPDLQAFHERYGDQVVLLGVNRGDPVPFMQRFIEEFGLTYTNLRDHDTRVAELYGVTGVPESYFVDRQGILRYRHIGPLDFGTMETVVQRILEP